jgi:drug/metabolite transporter (DMT)-like permease
VEKFFAVIGMASNAVKDTLFKTVAREEGGSHIVVFYALKAAFIAALAVALLLARRAGPLLHGPSLAYALPIAALTGLTCLAALVSLVRGDASTNVPIYRLNFVLSSAFAVVFWGEPLAPRKVAGTVLCLVAVLFFFLGSRAGARGGRHGDRRGLLASVVACFAAAGLNVMNKTALETGDLSLVVPISS